MGKQRKKKASRLLSEQKNQRRSLAAPKKNPFEQRKLKKKFEVVGQRLKPQEGAGQARSQALEQRKKTLLVEYQQRENVNAFIDKRIGEKDESLSHEEKMLIRYQKEKQRKLLKKSLFSLDDQEESLTHLGQSLSELDAFDDYMGSEDEEEVDSEIVSDYHFGGGIFQKVDQAEGRTREEIMKEVIAKSKYFKQLHQREREESIALTEELDDDLGNLLPLLSGHWKKNNEASPNTDEFDILTREFANEARAKPLNRLATPEEIAKKQRDRLELLEKERIKRMKGESSEEEENDDPVEEEESGEEKLGSEEEEDQMSDHHHFKKKKKGKFVYQAKPLTEKEMKLIDDSLKEGSIPFLINVPNSFEELQSLLDGKNALQIRIVVARILASNNANLGPSYKEHLQRMFELSLQYFEWRVNVHGGHTENDEQTQILDVLSQAFYTLLPSITPTAVAHLKERLIQMHLALDESLHINAMESDETARGTSPSHAIWKASDFFLFKVLSNLFPVTDYQHPIITPTMVLMSRYIVYVPVQSLSHIISKLYLSSMILHYATPAKRFVPEVLSYLQLVLLGCLSQKKHSLFTSATKQMIPLLQLRKGSKREKKIISQYQMAPLNLCRILLQHDNESPADIVKYQAVFSCVTLIGQFATLYEDYECYIELFTPFSNLLTALYGKALPPEVQELVLAIHVQIADKITIELNDRRPLTFPNLKPMPIRSLAPDFIENYIPGRDYDRNQERARHRALKKIVKAEKKGAMRELRKDNIFLENERMKKRIADDEERKEKYNQIMHQLESDQHQYNVSDKMAAKAK